MFWTRDPLREALDDDAGFRLLCSLAADTEARNGRGNGRIAASVPLCRRDLAPDMARHGAQQERHARLLGELSVRRGLEPVAVPREADHALLLERRGACPAHAKLDRGNPLNERDVIAHLAHAYVAEIARRDMARPSGRTPLRRPGGRAPGAGDRPGQAGPPRLLPGGPAALHARRTRRRRPVAAARERAGGDPRAPRRRRRPAGPPGAPAGLADGQVGGDGDMGPGGVRGRVARRPAPHGGPRPVRAPRAPRPAGPARTDRGRRHPRRAARPRRYSQPRRLNSWYRPTLTATISTIAPG